MAYHRPTQHWGNPPEVSCVALETFQFLKGSGVEDGELENSLGLITIMILALQCVSDEKPACIGVGQMTQIQSRVGLFESRVQ